MDANEGLRETVDEDKRVRRGPDPRQSVVENPWIDNSKFAMVRWINTRDRLQCIWNWLDTIQNCKTSFHRNHPKPKRTMRHEDRPLVCPL